MSPLRLARYLRVSDNLDADALGDLEEYFAHLRAYYGIPADQPVFPPRQLSDAASEAGTEGDVPRVQAVVTQRITLEEHAVNRGIVTTLRDFVPIRPLTRHEALGIAERQALRLLALTDLYRPPVPEQVIAELPRVEVKRMSPFPTSGATHWVSGRWVIILNGAEPMTRQRFSLAHEFKHILDHPFVGQLYGAIDSVDRHGWTEQVCDYFAGCVLMPRPWLKRAWVADQRLESLAKQFHVSHAAMNTRLNQIGLAPPSPRCAHRVPRRPGRSSSARYERLTPLLSGLEVRQEANT